LGSPVATLYGLIGTIALVVVFVSSVEYLRRKKFEVFYFLHFFFVGFIVFGALHHTNFQNFAIISGVVFFLDILSRIFWAKTIIPQKTTLFQEKSSGLVQVRFIKPFEMMLGRKINKVGQYIFVNFPAISIAEWHPFSVASSPDDEEIEINIRALGNWTNKVAEKAKSNSWMWIRIDGPYGNLNLNYRRYSQLLLVAGGIGITPILGLLRQIYCRKSPLSSRVVNVTVVWTVPTQREAAWFSSELDIILGNAATSTQKLDLRIHITRNENEPKDAAPCIFYGRPDMETIFGTISERKTPCLVFVCGPKKMVNSTWDITNTELLKGHFFHFHHETFEF